MKGTRFVSLMALASFALAAAASHASDAAMAKLMECMKLKAATPEQQACLQQVESLRRAAPKVVAVPADVKKAAAEVGLAGPVPQAAAGSIDRFGGGITVGNIQGLDLETAMMAVQSRRANLLEGQLKEQLETVSMRNDEIRKMNALIAELNALRPKGNDRNAWGNLGADKAKGKLMYDKLKAAGMPIPTSGEDRVDEAGGAGIYDARPQTFDAWLQKLKGKTDALNSTQQMDTLRMQSLTNKRNEAFDLMTNFIKKMADSRSSILGNMR